LPHLDVLEIAKKVKLLAMELLKNSAEFYDENQSDAA